MGMSENRAESRREAAEIARSTDFREGAQVISTAMEPSFDPPSGSLNPAATVAPRPEASASASSTSSSSTASDSSASVSE